MDYSLALVSFLAWALWAAALERGEGGLGPEALPAALLSILALLLKASAAPLLGFGVVLLLVRRSSVERSTWRALAIAAPAAVLPWLARGVAQSGCLVFPAAPTCLSFLPWAVPRDRVAEIARVIGDWARAPGLNAPPLSTWVPLWLPGVLADYPEAKLLPAIFLLGLALLAVVRPRLTAAFAWVTGGAALSSAFWFLTAPDMRFGLGALHALALAPAALALGGLALGEGPAPGSGRGGPGSGGAGGGPGAGPRRPGAERHHLQPAAVAPTGAGVAGHAGGADGPGEDQGGGGALRARLRRALLGRPAALHAGAGRRAALRRLLPRGAASLMP